MRFTNAVAVRIAISLAFCFAAFATQAGVQAQTNQLVPPMMIALSPRTFLRGSPSAMLQVIAIEEMWTVPQSTVNELLWNGALLSTTQSSGVYQATVPAALLTLSQPITISMRKRNTLTGEVALARQAQYAVVTDTVSSPFLSPTISVKADPWRVINLGFATLLLNVNVQDRYGLPLGGAPVLIDSNAGVFGSGYHVTPQSIVAYTYSNGNVAVPLNIQTAQLTQTITATINITASTIFVGEFASTTLSSTAVIQRSSAFLPAVLWRHPPENHDFCNPVYLSPAREFSRPPNAPQDVYQPFSYTQLPPGEPVISMSRGIRISNYSAVGRLELYSVQQNRCFYGGDGTVSAKLLASSPIPPRSQQPFQWCPPEARLGAGDQYFLIVVRNDAERSIADYTIAANFPVSSTQNGIAICEP